jgi:biopolymer transport protein ExbD
MKRRKSRTFRRGRIEIIPMIDVMFFLLVTFMIASLTMQKLNALPVNLPKGAAAPLEDKSPLTLSITGDGQIFLDKTPATLESLPTLLKERLNGRDRMIVSADDKAPHGIVVRSMLRSREAGVLHFLIAVRPE